MNSNTQTLHAPESKKSQNKLVRFLSKLGSNIIPIIFPAYVDLDPKTYKTYRNISILAILNICFLICVFTPFAVYSSDVSQFDVEQTLPTLASLFGIFLFASALLLYITSFFYKTRILKFGVWYFGVLLLVCLSYAFIFTGNIFTGLPYAQLDGLLFRDGGAGISHVYAKYFDIFYFFCMCVLCLFLLKLLNKILLSILAFLFSVLVISTCFSIGDIISQYLKIQATQENVISKNNTKEQNTNFVPPEYVTPYLSFSKEKNIVVLFSDMIQADNFTQALKDMPEIYDDFEGFTYYENALSSSSITFGSSPSISGGSYYHPLAINSRNLDHNIAYEHASAIADIANAFEKAQYEVSIGFHHYVDRERLVKKLNKGIFLTPNGEGGAWVEFYKQQYKIPSLEDDRNSLPIGDLFSIGLFRVASYIARARIYQAEGWIFGNSLLNNHYKTALNNASKIPAFSTFSNLNAKKPTFKYLYESSEHFPWLLDVNNDCKPIVSHSQYRSMLMNNKDTLAYSNHLCHVKSLTRWLDWFKKSGIYDQTKIIIVSDHGNGGNGSTLIDFPRRELRSSHVLVLVKEFNSKGKLKIDKQTFVSNTDTMAFACDELGGGIMCPKIKPSILKSHRKNRELVFTLVDGGTGRATKNTYDTILSYKVKNSIFNLENWTDITEEIKNGNFKIDWKDY